MNTRARQFGRSTLRLLTGDITRIPVDAIANAANSALAGGVGVDGAIHRAAGPGLMRELDAVRPADGLPAGQAVATGAGDLPAKFVFHAVGPIWRGGKHGEAEALVSCYLSCLRLAEERAARTLSFPSISTGAYGYPVDEAAALALNTVAGYFEQHQADTLIDEVLFVLFDGPTFSAYARALDRRSSVE
ncbi:MAG: macro domain-containing protein [Bryobacteraceae bacterium]|nr:macro domain-containing protein [Bryobacteraceae bacterium]